MLSPLVLSQSRSNLLVGEVVMQRSRECPYLWIKLRKDSVGYISGISCSSVFFISWLFGLFLRSARSQLRDEVLSSHFHGAR